MNRATFLLLALPMVLLADPPVNKPLDAKFLQQYAQTRGFLAGRPVNPKPTPDGKHVLFLRTGPTDAKRALFEFDVTTGKTRELLTAEAILRGAEENLTPEEKARRERMRISAGGFADYFFDESGTKLLLPLSGKLFIFDRTTEKVRELPIAKGTLIDPKWSPDGQRISYVRDHDLYTFDPATNVEVAVTSGGTIEKTNGLAEFVAQEEMGRFTGYWWSPDGKFIAFEEADHAGVETWYVSDPARPDQKPLQQYYPRPGKKNVAVRLGIVPSNGGKVVWVNWDRATHEYLAVVKWDKHGPLTIQVQDRKQQEIQLFRVNVETGYTSKMFSAVDKAFTNLRQDMPRWLPDATEFLWVSDDALGPMIELRNGADAFLKDRLIPADEGLISVVHVDKKYRELVYIASKDTSEAHVYSRGFEVTGIKPVFPGSEKARRLGMGAGIESIVFSENKNVFALTSTLVDVMPRSFVYTRDKLVGELPSVANEPEFLPKVTIERVGGEKRHNVAIVRPHDFDAKKKYPVIVDIYGGPHHLHVVRAMKNWLVPQWIADQGFVVVAIENRGTPGRGRDWERAIYQSLGTVPLEDQAKVLKELGSAHPELDLDRVGMIGWSFGGYMSALSVLKRPDLFKAAVAGAPVTDWEDYDSHYTERYMGVLPESRQAYDRESLLPLAANLERPLLLVHGTADDNVYYRHTLKLANALLRAGRDFDMFPLPGVTHMVTADPLVFERYMTKATSFFRKHLGAAK